MDRKEKRPASKSHTFPESENIEQGKRVQTPVLVAFDSLLGALDWANLKWSR